MALACQNRSSYVSTIDERDITRGCRPSSAWAGMLRPHPTFLVRLVL